MSHFTVAVFSREDENIDDLLENFCEDPDCLDDDVLEFADKTDEVLQSWEKVKNGETENWSLSNYEDLDDFAYKEFGYSKCDADDISGTRYGYYFNPNAKYDWYTVGGRWSNMLKLKNGETTDSASISELDFSLDKDAYANAERFWEVVVDGDEPKNEKEEEMLKFNFYKPSYYVEKYKNKETYATLASSFSTFAVLKDGIWHESGKMGWWGISSETLDEALNWEKQYSERFLQNVDDHYVLTIVDCHI